MIKDKGDFGLLPKHFVKSRIESTFISERVEELSDWRFTVDDIKMVILVLKMHITYYLFSLILFLKMNASLHTRYQPSLLQGSCIKVVVSVDTNQIDQIRI